MNINVDVTDLDLNSVVEHEVTVDYEGDPIGKRGVTLADKVVDKLVAKAIETADYTSLKERVKEIREEVVREAVTPLIAEAFTAGLQRTDHWGKPIGEPMTLREVVIEEARTVLNGVKEDRYNSSRQEPLVRQLVRKMVDDELRAELSEVIKEERAKVVAAVRGAAAELLAEAVTKGIGSR